jgi:very-short-patch-repair endonuclease
MTSVQADRAIDQTAAVQFGLVSHAQAIEAGVSDGGIARRLSSGAWLRLAPAVYALASHPATWQQGLMAAVLGECQAVISGPSAAALHGLRGFRPGPIQVVVPRGANHRSGLAVVRERSDFQATAVDGIPVLTVCDTLFSVAASAHASRVALAMDDALGDRVITVGDLQLRYEQLRGGRRPGMATMRRLIGLRSHQGFLPPASVLERMLYGVLDRAGMPAYIRQARVPWSPDQVVDAMLRDARLIIEADGRRWHTRMADFERDRRRDRVAAEHGYRTMRYTYADLGHDQDRVAAEVCAAARAAA